MHVLQICVCSGWYGTSLFFLNLAKPLHLRKIILKTMRSPIMVAKH